MPLEPEPILKFDTPLNDNDTLQTASEKVARYHRSVTSTLNLASVADWLVDRGVLSEPDPLTLWAAAVPPHLLKDNGAWSDDATSYTGICYFYKEHEVNNAVRLCERVASHIERAYAAFRDKRGEGTLNTFLTELGRAQDAALAALEAGYVALPMQRLFDFITGLIAYIVNALRQEIMRRILNGRITGEAATDALAMLNDRWTPQHEANAQRLRDQIGAKRPH
jgi:hypothetical protein